jgi:hypothetical protein
MRAPKLDVLEVMCSDHSELAKQADSLGGRARRFGLSQGDLQTVAGRKKLFEILIMGNPEHLWYSPECGPWSMWSNFNMGRSMDGFYDVLEKRRQSLWQLSLAVVLFRFQASRSKHFHLEQPDGSKMLIQECLREIRGKTLKFVVLTSAEWDLYVIQYLPCLSESDCPCVRHPKRCIVRFMVSGVTRIMNINKLQAAPRLETRECHCLHLLNTTPGNLPDSWPRLCCMTKVRKFQSMQ